MAWSLMAFSVAGMGVSMYWWARDKITTRAMVGLTLGLSWLALTYSAITTLFVT